MDKISVRDWFAGQALSAMDLKVEHPDGVNPVRVAKLAYEIADVMLEKQFRPKRTVEWRPAE